MIAHQMEVIKEICERVAVIEHGKIIEQGSTVDLFTNPQTETLKKFIGTVMSTEVPEQLSHMNIHKDKERKTIRQSSAFPSAGTSQTSRSLQI